MLMLGLSIREKEKDVYACRGIYDSEGTKNNNSSISFSAFNIFLTLLSAFP